MEAVAEMMVAEPVPQNCGGGGGSHVARPTSLRSHSVPSMPSRANGVDSIDEQNVVSRKNAVATRPTASPSPGRRVTFPVAEVTGIVEPPNPWKKAVDITSTDAIVAYAAACDRYHVRPLDKVIQQVKKIENFEKRISCLNLQGEELDAGQIEALEEIFKRIQFDTINLEGASLNEQGATALFDMIEYYESVQHLIISGNKTSFSMREWQGFCRMIKNTRCLGELEMTGVAIGDNINIVARTLRTCSNLAALHLDNCNLSGKYFTILMNGLVNSSVRELYVANNRLSSTDAVQVGSHLGKNPMLKLLHLGNNHLEDGGMAHIANGMCELTSGVYSQSGLSTLVVHNNQLSNKSTCHFARILSDCPDLTALDVSFNNLNNEFVHGVKDPLIRNHTLTNLCLRGCHVTCVGAVALAEYIADSSSLELLDLRDNNIKIGGLMALTHSMEVSKSVSKLDLDGVSLKDNLEDPAHHHQNLLYEIGDYCKRNHEIHEKKRAEDEAAAAAKGDDSSSKEEVLSVPVTRLLSLWSNQPIKKTQRSVSVNSSPPIIISSIVEAPTDDPTTTNETSGWQMVRGTSHFLRSPQPSPACSPIPSPTKNRFRVTRVFQEADSTSANDKNVVPSSSKDRFGGRFNKFTVTPVRTIDGVDVNTEKPVQRKSDSDLLSALSTPGSVGSSTTLEVQRLLDTAKDAGDEEDMSALYGSPSEEEGEDSVFLDVPPVGPNQRVRHDSMRVHRRRLSNGDDLIKQTLEPLLSDGGATNGLNSTDTDDASPDSNAKDKSAPHEKFGLQNAVDSLEISSLKAGFLKDQLESLSSSFGLVDEAMERGVVQNGDGKFDGEDGGDSNDARFDDDDGDDDLSSGADRDSGIYLLDAGADDLGTPFGERLEEVKILAEESAEKLEEKDDRPARSVACEEAMDVEVSGEVTSAASDDGTSPSGVSFNLVDIGENDEYFNAVTNREYSGSWVVTTAEGRVQSVHQESEMFRCLSSNSLMDLLTGSESDEWCSPPPIVTSCDSEESGDLMLFIEKDSSRAEAVTGDVKVDGGSVDQMHLPNDRRLNESEASSSVVSAWISRNSWTEAQDGRDSIRPKNMENLLQRIAPCGSESSSSSDSGVPESPMSCSPPVVDPRAANSPGKRKAAVLSANSVSLGLDVLERLDRKAGAMPISSGQVIQSRGLMDMAAEFLMSREGLNGAVENRREAASSCLGLNNKLSPTTTVSHRGIANEAGATTSTTAT